MWKFVSVFLVFIGLAGTAEAATCNASFANSVVARMNSIVKTSTTCRKILYDQSSSTGRICTSCQGTISKLLALQNTYRRNKSCFESDPKIRSHFNTLWSYKRDVDRLQRVCGS
jgi:hypothetical protein